MKKKLHFFMLFMALAMMMVWPAKGRAQYDGIPVKPTSGQGTDDDPYLIATAANLYWFSIQVYGGNIRISARLTNDIVFNAGTFDENGKWSESGTPYSWLPIGTIANTFCGKIYGDGHTISGLYCSTTNGSQSVGLVGDAYSDNCYIEKVGVINCFFKGKEDVGGIAGFTINAKITDCYVTGTIVGDSHIGGIVGYNIGNISNCFSKVNISGNISVGGIYGYSRYNATNCYTNANLLGGGGELCLAERQ